MKSGNMLADRQDIENDIRTFKCSDCNGKGSIPWKELPDWQQQMNEKIEDEIWKNTKRHGHRTNVEVARDVRKQGSPCKSCDQTGEIYI